MNFLRNDPADPHIYTLVDQLNKQVLAPLIEESLKSVVDQKTTEMDPIANTMFEEFDKSMIDFSDVLVDEDNETSANKELDEKIRLIKQNVFEKEVVLESVKNLFEEFSHVTSNTEADLEHFLRGIALTENIRLKKSSVHKLGDSVQRFTLMCLW